jgi:uncharacterized protein GlcG (DUF336 family)
MLRLFAKQHNVTVSIAIIDPFSEMIYFERMDGPKGLNMSTAILKVKTALNTRALTYILYRRCEWRLRGIAGVART